MSMKVKHLYECPYCHEELSRSDDDEDTYTTPDDAGFIIYLWCSECEVMITHYFDYNSSSSQCGYGEVTDLGRLQYEDGLSGIGRLKYNIVNNYYINLIYSKSSRLLKIIKHIMKIEEFQ